MSMYSWWAKTTVGDIQQEMSGTTNVFGRDKSIRVMFVGKKVTAADGVVTFPAMDAGITLSSSTLKMMRGLVDHQAALVRFSNRKFLLSKEELQKSNMGLHELFLAIEGARVENAYTEYYYGAGKNLEELSSIMFEQGKATFQEEYEFYPTAISMFARKRMPGVFNSYECAKMTKFVDEKMVEDWVDEIETFTTADQSFELAERIFKQSGQPPKKSPSSGEEEENSPGKPLTLEALIKKTLESEEAASARPIYDKSDIHGPYLVYSTEDDQVIHWCDGSKSENIKHYMYVKSGMDAALATAKRKLELMIQATQKISWDTMKERGRLDSRRLVAAYQGEPQVFKIKKDASDLDTAICICVDMSGSMNGGNKSHYAFAATIIFAELLSKIGVPFEVTGFNTGNLSRSSKVNTHAFQSRVDPDMYGQFARIENLNKHDFKRFTDRFFDARKYMWGLCQASGANVDGESIINASRPLMKRPEKRKIMIVLSDGQPASDGNDSRLYGHLQRTVTELSRHMEIVGIGVCTDAVKSFYPEHIVIKDAANLPETLLNLLGKKLLPSEKAKRVNKIA